MPDSHGVETGFRVRRGTKADVPVLLPLIADLFSREPDFRIDAAKQAAGLDLILGSPDRSVVLVAESAGRVIGMVTGQLVASTSEGAWSVLLEDMVVSEAWRGRGVGRSLVAELEAWGKARGAKRLQLVADGNNHPALAFYRSLGFSDTSLVARMKRFMDPAKD